MEPGHSGQIGCESLALALLKLLDQVLDGLSNDLLGGCLLAADSLLAAAPAVAVVVAAELHVFVLILFRRDRLSVFLNHGWETRRRLAEKNERSARRWESGGRARQVTNAHHRLARSRAPNGLRRPLSSRHHPARGRPPRWRGVGWKELTCRRIQRPRQGSLLKVVAKLLSTDGPDLTGRSGVVDQHVVDLVDYWRSSAWLETRSTVASIEGLRVILTSL